MRRFCDLFQRVGYQRLDQENVAPENAVAAAPAAIGVEVVAVGGQQEGVAAQQPADWNSVLRWVPRPSRISATLTLLAMMKSIAINMSVDGEVGEQDKENIIMWPLITGSLVAITSFLFLDEYLGGQVAPPLGIVVEEELGALPAVEAEEEPVAPQQSDVEITDLSYQSPSL